MAIEVARRSGIPLKIAAKVDRSDEAYFNTVIKPLLSSSTIEYVGEISESQSKSSSVTHLHCSFRLIGRNRLAWL